MNRGFDLKLKTVELVRAFFTAKKVQVSVTTADPRKYEDFPCIAVNRIKDGEDQEGFANFYDNEAAATGNNEVLSGLFDGGLELRIWTENAEQRDTLYVLLKECLILIKAQLAAVGMGNVIIRSGRDENDFVKYPGHFIYWGVLSLFALAPMDVLPDTPDASATTITEVDAAAATPDFSSEPISQTVSD